MTTTTRLFATTPERVWKVLEDGWLYPLWVVGAARTRAVDPTWPAVGAKLHHSVGLWPLMLDDNTEVLAVDPQRSISLQARAWPVGEAHVDITLEPHGAGTLVSMTEFPCSGPMAALPEPVIAPGLIWRNKETLKRLVYLAEGRA